MKIKNLSTVVVIFLLSVSIHGQDSKTKIIENGSNGPYSTIAISHASFPDFVIYRPEKMMAAVEKEGRLPVLAWANGGCMNSSIHHEKVLSKIASHGYIIVAIGKLQMTVEERVHESTPNDELKRALEWISKEAKSKNSEYYEVADLNSIGIAGQSCGGAQVMNIAGDERVKTYMMFNSGMGEMSMAGASAASFKKLNGPVLYVEGGESDVAYNNGLIDYEAINNVPVAFANLLEGGHMGTFSEEYGGSFARMALNWLDWQLKGKDSSDIFLNANLEGFPGWSMKTKNF